VNAPQTPTEQANNLAIAGFICSVLGILGTCGLLSPIGLILSLVALGREPRGFAIAGAVIGALGTCLVVPVLIFAVALPMVFLSVLAALGISGVLGPGFTAKIEMAELAGKIKDYQRDHTMLPITLDDLGIADTDLLSDRWGHPYGYELSADGLSYRLFSLGPDGVAGTPDDIQANPRWVIQTHSETTSTQGSPPASPPSP